MPRQTQSNSGSKRRSQDRPKRKRAHERALNALALANEPTSHTPDEPTVASKRRRIGGRQGEESVGVSGRERLQHDDSRDSDEYHGSSGGSDSEGNKWRIGHVNTDDDSDLDSDEAFGESDDERFEGFTFRGSTQRGTTKNRSKTRLKDGDAADLPSEQVAFDDTDDSADDFGDDAVDLATMLDQSSDDDLSTGTSNDGMYQDDESISAPDDDRTGIAASSRIQNLVSSLPVHPAELNDKSSDRTSDAKLRPESRVPTTKLRIEDMLADVGSELSSMKKSQKLVNAKPQTPRSSGIPGKLSAPLPKRQKDRLDRIAANKEAKKTLDRWVDTVKGNRRADHLAFPLPQPDDHRADQARRVRPTTDIPQTELDLAINQIMEESGMKQVGVAESESQLQTLESVETQRRPLEDIQKKHAQLRLQRDLMFREELRAKRLKKIKSKAYRRVHRRERERLAAKDALEIDEDGHISDDERERFEKLRAEERMNTRHRDSKWAKEVKSIGQALWDRDARVDMEDMARRKEDLRRRIRGEDPSTSILTNESAGEESDGESHDTPLTNGGEVLLRELEADARSTTVAKGISAMKFMQVAEAEKRAQNDAAFEELKRELGSNPAQSDNDSDTSQSSQDLRRQYGPRNNAPATLPIQRRTASEFEELDYGSDSRPPRSELANVKPSVTIENSGLKQGRTRLKTNRDVEKSVPSAGHKVVEIGPGQSGPRQASRDGMVEVSTPAGVANARFTAHSGGVSEAERHSPEHDLTLQERLVRQAFGGDEVDINFELEKAAQVAEDDDKVVDNAVPGWGAWTGAGVSKREKNRHKGKSLTVTEGVKPEDRRDSKLKGVIINERTIKKNQSFLASTLPFPFTSKDEYERSMRMPVGAEWNTKTTLQANLKPRVLIKPGLVIAPIARPMI